MKRMRLQALILAATGLTTSTTLSAQEFPTGSVIINDGIRYVAVPPLPPGAVLISETVAAPVDPVVQQAVPVQLSQDEQTGETVQSSGQHSAAKVPVGEDSPAGAWMPEGEYWGKLLDLERQRLRAEAMAEIAEMKIQLIREHLERELEHARETIHRLEQEIGERHQKDEEHGIIIEKLKRAFEENEREKKEAWGMVERLKEEFAHHAGPQHGPGPQHGHGPEHGHHPEHGPGPHHDQRPHHEGGPDRDHGHDDHGSAEMRHRIEELERELDKTRQQLEAERTRAEKSQNGMREQAEQSMRLSRMLEELRARMSGEGERRGEREVEERRMENPRNPQQRERDKRENRGEREEKGAA